MKYSLILLAFFVLSSCAQLIRPSGKTDYFSGESTHYAADGKSVVGEKRSFLLEFTMANDRSKIFEKRSFRNLQTGKAEEADSELTRIGQSEGYTITGPKGHIVGVMSYTNPERTTWGGEIFFDGGGRMTYTSTMTEGQGKTESLVYGADRKLVGVHKTEYTTISAAEYKTRTQELKATK
jgi:hypothetical protein